MFLPALPPFLGIHFFLFFLREDRGELQLEVMTYI